mmetsp:Transcript_123594/g.384799  ORF Transcript_123594/g.384799 Transcript_123594/m.384799 type:complete len:274 (-) Transcript_123594:435-1256(-)
MLFCTDQAVPSVLQHDGSTGANRTVRAAHGGCASSGPCLAEGEQVGGRLRRPGAELVLKVQEVRRLRRGRRRHGRLLLHSRHLGGCISNANGWGCTWGHEPHSTGWGGGRQHLRRECVTGPHNALAERALEGTRCLLGHQRRWRQGDTARHGQGCGQTSAECRSFICWATYSIFSCWRRFLVLPAPQEVPHGSHAVEEQIRSVGDAIAHGTHGTLFTEVIDGVSHGVPDESRNLVDYAVGPRGLLLLKWRRWLEVPETLYPLLQVCSACFLLN